MDISNLVRSKVTGSLTLEAGDALNDLNGMLRGLGFSENSDIVVVSFTLDPLGREILTINFEVV